MYKITRFAWIQSEKLLVFVESRRFYSDACVIGAMNNKLGGPSSSGRIINELAEQESNSFWKCVIDKKGNHELHYG